MLSRLVCTGCESPLSPHELACARCGLLNTRDPRVADIECENHTGEQAVARCFVCGKPVCGDCAVESKEEFFCNNPDHPPLAETWDTLLTCESEFEGDLIEKNLRAGGIPCQVFPYHQHVGVSWVEVQQEVRVMVPNNMVERARALCLSLGLLDAHDFSLSGNKH